MACRSEMSDMRLSSSTWQGLEWPGSKLRTPKREGWGGKEDDIALFLTFI